MSCSRKFSIFFLAFLSIGFISSSVLADCGDQPVKPELPDGKTATMDELVATSNAVKSFIAEADAYLDCSEKEIASEEFQALDDKQQNQKKKEVKALLKSRNNIADDFNKEVGAYKKANPE